MDIYRVAICYTKDCSYFLVIYDSQIVSIVRISHISDRPLSLYGFSFILQSIALDRVETNCTILRKRRMGIRVFVYQEQLNVLIVCLFFHS